MKSASKIGRKNQKLLSNKKMGKMEWINKKSKKSTNFTNQLKYESSTNNGFINKNNNYQQKIGFVN